VHDADVDVDLPDIERADLLIDRVVGDCPRDVRLDLVVGDVRRGAVAAGRPRPTLGRQDDGDGRERDDGK
jgi:hypothetical protein